MRPSISLNSDPSTAPSWLVVLLLTASFAAEILDHGNQPPTITPEECASMCPGGVDHWNPSECRCRVDHG